MLNIATGKMHGWSPTQWRWLKLSHLRIGCQKTKCLSRHRLGISIPQVPKGSCLHALSRKLIYAKYKEHLWTWRIAANPLLPQEIGTILYKISSVILNDVVIIHSSIICDTLYERFCFGNHLYYRKFRYIFYVLWSTLLMAWHTICCRSDVNTRVSFN